MTKSGSYTLRFDSARALMGLMARLVPPGPSADVLMVRPFLVTVLPQFGPVFLRNDEEIRRTKLELAKPLMDAYWNEGVAQRLKVHERLRLELVARQRPDLLVDVLEFIKAKSAPTPVLKKRNTQLYLAYPHYGSARPGPRPDLPRRAPRGRGVPGLAQGRHRDVPARLRPQGPPQGAQPPPPREAGRHGGSLRTGGRRGGGSWLRECPRRPPRRSGSWPGHASTGHPSAQ